MNMQINMHNPAVAKAYEMPDGKVVVRLVERLNPKGGTVTLFLPNVQAWDSLVYEVSSQLPTALEA